MRVHGHFREIFMSKTLPTKGSVTMKNLNGTSDKNCTCGSWLNHWKTFTKASSTPKCHVAGCNSSAEVGAHVILPKLDNESLRKQNYIAPMCKSHNGQPDTELKSKPDSVFVSANKALTCEA
jgi:hypothetical protein